MNRESEPYGFALSEEDEDRLDRVLLESGREPICVRLKLLMAAQRWNAVIFTERTGLEGYLFSKINRSAIKRPTMATVIAICVALCLNYPQTVDLLASGGMVFGNDPVQRIYRRLILEMHGRSVDECNEYLLARGMPPLGSVGRDEREIRISA